LTLIYRMNVRPGSSRHARGSNDYGFLLAISEKVVVFDVIDVDLVETFAFVYIGSAVDGALNLRFRDFLRSRVLLEVRYDPVPAQQDCCKAQHRDPKSHSFPSQVFSRRMIVLHYGETKWPGYFLFTLCECNPNRPIRVLDYPALRRVAGSCQLAKYWVPHMLVFVHGFRAHGNPGENRITSSGFLCLVP